MMRIAQNLLGTSFFFLQKTQTNPGGSYLYCIKLYCEYTYEPYTF